MTVKFTQENQDTQVTQDKQEIQAREFIARLPSNCIPRDPNHMHRCVFHLARMLKAELREGNESHTILPQHVRDKFSIWCSEFQDTALEGLYDWETLWEEFLYASSKVRKPRGEVLREIMSRPVNFPPAIYEHQMGEKADLIMEVCYQLSITNEHDGFFLDVRTAGQLINISHTRAAKILSNLVTEGLLVIREKGHRGRATEYHLNANVYRYEFESSSSDV